MSPAGYHFCKPAKSRVSVHLIDGYPRTGRIALHRQKRSQGRRTFIKRAGIAARFNGRAEAFNHFAQDAHFNRGRYRAMEDEWARAKRAGKRVTVRIVPRYTGTSIRPSVIDIWFTIDDREHSQKIPNERTEPSHAK